MKQRYVYFIQDTRRGTVKIGTTTDVQARLRTLQTGNGAPLRLLGTFTGGYAEETAIHAQLSAHRVHGEWFDRDAVFAFIRTIPAERWVWLNPGPKGAAAAADHFVPPTEKRVGTEKVRRRFAEKKKPRWTAAQRRDRG